MFNKYYPIAIFKNSTLSDEAREIMKFINEKIASRTSIHTAGTDPVARPPQGIGDK